MTDILDDAALGAGLSPSFQRVVSLPGGTVVGYEALARWPHLDATGPLQVFAHAARKGTLDVLDRECIRRAADAALRGNSAPGMLLLINCEPSTEDLDLADDTLSEAAGVFQLMFELTERGLLDNPRALLRKVDALRSHGFRIALDDIGAQRDSLALLDIIAPEILKLDMGLVQNQPDDVQARTVAAIIGHHERTGATILAEGIETDLHLEQALAYGASIGPGLPVRPPRPADHRARRSGAALVDVTHTGVDQPVGIRAGLPGSGAAHGAQADPARAVPAHRTPGPDRRQHPDRARDRAACRQLRRPDSRHVHTDRAALPLVVVFGEGVPEEPEPGIRGVSVDADDPLATEWTVLVLGPDTAAGLIAREQPAAHPPADDGDRRFESVITFDRARVTAAARSLLARLPDNAVGGWGG